MKTSLKKINFEYSQDERYFADLLCGGKIEVLEEKYGHLFDFREPAVKRAEFNALRSKLLPELMECFGGRCGLCIDGICEVDRKLAVDHFIPLSSNILNKELRHLSVEPGRKVATQSFGSNHPGNLVLACSACNSYKKHRFPDAELISRVLGVK